MSYTDTTDTVVAALAGMLPSAVNAALAAEMLSEPVLVPVARAYQMPIPLRMVPVLQLPCLLVYRRRTNWIKEGRHDRRRATIRIDYVGPQSPAASLEDIWPLLERVFEAVSKAITADVGDVLEAAGVTHLDLPNTVADYDFVSDKGALNVYPMFASTWFLVHQPNVPNLVVPVNPPVSLAADLNKVRPTPEPSGNPLAQVEVTTTP